MLLPPEQSAVDAEGAGPGGLKGTEAQLEASTKESWCSSNFLTLILPFAYGLDFAHEIAAIQSIMRLATDLVSFKTCWAAKL